MLQFGPCDQVAHYRLRPAVFGVAHRDGLIACVRVERPDGAYYDLPGGAVDGDETEPQALSREFLEETGLNVSAGLRLGQAGQTFQRSDGERLNNVGGFWVVQIQGQDLSAQCEADHTLVWLEPARALCLLRHEAHAWAVVLWMRAQIRP